MAVRLGVDCRRTGLVANIDAPSAPSWLPYPSESRTANAYFDRSKRLHRKRKFKSVVRDLTEAINHDDQHAPAYMRRGMALTLAGSHDDAISDLEKAIELDSTLSESYLMWAIVQWQLRRYDGVEAALDRALLEDPKFGWGYANRAFYFFQNGDYGRALSDAIDACETEQLWGPTHNIAVWIFATCADTKYRREEAALDWGRQLVGWKHWDWNDTFAAACAASGIFDEAIEWQNKAIDNAPSDERAELAMRLDSYKSQQPFYAPPAAEDNSST